MMRTSLFLMGLLVAVAPALAEGGRERLSMDTGWRFHLGDPSDVKGGTFDAAGPGAKASDFGAQVASAKAKADDFEKDAEAAKHRVDPVKANVGGDLPVVSAGFDDGGWDAVQLPHDWAVGLPFDKRGDLSHGYKQIGGELGNSIGWYRRSFELPASDKGKALSIEFDGVYRDCLVWLNGHCLGRNASGYMSFAYDIGSAANYGGKNELVVRVDASQAEGWWYEGAGIYRHVWLWKTNAVHLAQWGVNVFSKVNLDGASADVVAQAHLVDTRLFRVRPVDTVTETVFDAQGQVVATAKAQVIDYTSIQMTVSQPHLWSLDDPYLYTLVTTVKEYDGVLDEVRTPFGIRTIKFDVEKGFFLNGKHVQIQGTCNHQDAAGVGVAIPDALNVWRLEQLKKFGCNAIRCSHNPPTPEVLDACDRLGILVMDEHRKSGRTPEILDQLQRLIKRDRNHPSIILWSFGNEEQNIQGKPVGEEIAKVMKATIEALDKTRPITVAMDSGWGAGFSNVVDIQGFNYPLKGDMTRYHKDHPSIPMMGSEEASTVTTRGIYQTDAKKGYVTAYDVTAPPWAVTAERWVTYYQRRPFMAGCFIWTGFDYRGEPTPYEWPCINSHFGVLDTCGFFKDEAYYYQSVWTDKPMVHLLPHWNWAGKEGQGIDVWAYSNGDEVELLQDGKSWGRQKLAKGLHVSWQVPYEPGTLVAKAYRNGEVIATDTVATTGGSTQVVLTIDRTTINADGADVAVVNVALADAQGQTVPTSTKMVRFKVEGAGKNIGVGNGDPSCHEPDKADQRSAFNGLCQMIVQSTGGAGPITVTVSAEGLPATTATITAAPCPARPSVP